MSYGLTHPHPSEIPPGSTRHGPSGITGSLGLLLVLSVSGCQSSHWATGQDSLPYPPIADRHGSLVLARPELAQAVEERETMAVQWYESRNDQRRHTLAGIRSPVYEQEITYTLDRQIQSGHQIRDYYIRTTYRRRYQESVR